MINPAIIKADKRAHRLINFSLLYLLSTWIAAIVVFFDVNKGKIGEDLASTEITWVVLVQVALSPFFIAIIVFGTLWLRGLILTSRSIQPEGFGYRQGWAFWGWVTPLAQWWIPKRLIDNTTAIFDEFVGNKVLRNTTRWWTLWVLSSVISLIAGPMEYFSQDLVNIFGVVSVAVMTLSFPLWRNVIEESTAAQREAITKLEVLP